jgi:DNA polymerase-3 subunit alpha
MPRFPVPDGETEETLFIKQVHEGLDRRYPNGVPAQARERADHEITIILQMGFPGYFLVTADLILWAKSQGIRVGPGRGSATGAMVAYAMGITELDPLEHGLLFERFLNPERVSMPDIDIDFDERRRGEVMRYVTQRYGEDRVAQVVTYGTIKAKQALKDASRVLGYPFAMGERITKAMPPSVMGKDIPLTAVFDKSHRRHGEAGELRALYESDPDAKKIVDTAGQLENLKRQWGVHACAVILSREPLLEVIPLMKREQDGAIITQFDYPTCEALGLLKMDFLGLRNLTVVDDCLANIARNRDERVDVESLTFDDPATYQLLGRGDTLGVFQLDGGPMRSLLRGMKPDVFDDITAVLALYRPGPMATNAHNDYADRKNRRQQVVPIHPELAEPLNEVLGETHGLVVYQEQVMAIATGPVTRLSPTGRRTSRRTTPRSTWRPCSPAFATTRTSRRSISTSAAGWASRCCRPTSTSRRPTSPPSALTSASASRRSATSETTLSTALSGRASRRAGSPTSVTS